MGNDPTKFNHIIGYGETKVTALDSLKSSFEWHYGGGMWEKHHKKIEKTDEKSLLEKSYEEHYIHDNIGCLYRIYWLAQNGQYKCYIV